jgi:hypothetical protein
MPAMPAMPARRYGRRRLGGQRVARSRRVTYCRMVNTAALRMPQALPGPKNDQPAVLSLAVEPAKVKRRHRADAVSDRRIGRGPCDHALPYRWLRASAPHAGSTPCGAGARCARWCISLTAVLRAKSWTRGSLFDHKSKIIEGRQVGASAIDNGVGTHREGAERLDAGWRGVQVGPGGGQLIQPGEVL